MVAAWHFLCLGIKFLILVKLWSWDEPKLFKPRLPQLAFTPPSPISKLKCIIKMLHLYPLFPSIIWVRISFLSKIFESKKVYYKQLSICWKHNTSKKNKKQTQNITVSVIPQHLYLLSSRKLSLDLFSAP